MGFWNRQKDKADSSNIETAPVAKSGKRRKVLPMEVKLLAIDALEAGLTTAEVSDLVGASPAALAKWRRLYVEGGERALLRRASNPGSRRLCGELTRRIERMREDHPEAGVRRIRDELRREDGVAVSAETVRRVVNDAGLNNPPVQEHRRPPQVRRFERDLPNAMWQIDIFTFSLKRLYPVYLIGMIDDHSRYIVGHGLYRQQTADSVLEVVKGAIGQWGAPREILSDNGRQFAAWRGETKFQKTLKRQGVSHVRSAPHHPMTLGKIERFWKTIWTEFLEDAVFASFADARQRLDHWIAYYNHQRPHQGIGGACPADRFYGVASDVEEALKQGCRENALQLALGQETRPPFYLLGKLGATDVRVVRKGEEIEVRLGEEVREVIRLGPAFQVDADGECRREERDGVETDERFGAASDRGAGPVGGGDRVGALPDLWDEPSDPVVGDGEGTAGGGRGLGPEAPRPQGAHGGGAYAGLSGPGEGGVGEGPGPLAAEVRDRHDHGGPSAASVEWRGAARGGGPSSSEKKAAPAAQEAEDYEDIWSGPGGSGGGPTS